MISLSSHRRYWLYRQPIHINRSFYSLAGIVQEYMGADPRGADLFIFLNRRCTQMKILSWEGDGFGIYHKKLEKGTFELPAEGAAGHMQITHHQGIRLSGVHYRPRYEQKKVVC